MKLSKAGQVLKGPFFLNKRSEGASFCLATHPRQQRTPFLTSHAEGKKKKKGTVLRQTLGGCDRELKK